MSQILHPCAVTTSATRRKIQNSQKSIAKPAKQYGTAPNTVFKWKKQNKVHIIFGGERTSKLQTCVLT